MLLARNKLLHNPRDTSTTFPHGGRELPLVVPAITLNKMLEQLITPADADQHLLANDFAVDDFDTGQEMGVLDVDYGEVVDLAQLLDRPHNIPLDMERSGILRRRGGDWRAADSDVVRLKILLKLQKLVGVVCIGGHIITLIR